MWAVIATVFVCRFSDDQSGAAAVSRVAATSVSFVLCLAYLIFLPFHAWALAVQLALATRRGIRFAGSLLCGRGRLAWAAAA